MDITTIGGNIGIDKNNNYNYDLEFKQLKAYYNFRIDFKKKLQEKKSTFNYDSTKYYLIDRKWLQNWKIHVGYNVISVERMKDKLDEKKLDNNDYNNILNYLKIFSNQNTIFPLVNKNIFINGEVNPIGDFVVVDKDCYDSFTSGNDQLNKENKTFDIMFFKDKFLLKFSENQFLLAFKIEEENIYEMVKEHSWELVLTLKEKVDEKALINFFSNAEYNIIYWLKDSNFYINSTEKQDVNLNEGSIFVFNKALLINKGRNLSNTINPQMNNGIMQTMKINNYNFSEEDKKEMRKEQAKTKINLNNDNTLQFVDSKIKNDQMKNNNMNNIKNPNNMSNTNNMNNTSNINNNNNMYDANNRNKMISMNNQNNNINVYNANNNGQYMMNYNNANYGNNMNSMNYMNNSTNNNIPLNCMNMYTNNMINANNNCMINMNNQQNSNNQMNNFNNINNQGKYENPKMIYQKSNRKYPHRTGLQNVGQTCYMNSTIQCLSNIKYLSEYLISHFGKFDIEKQPLSVSFSSLIYDLFNTKNKDIAPKLFKKIIGKLNPLFEGMHAADAKDLIFFLLETLHQELNKKKDNSEQTNIDYAQLEKDSFDENKMFQRFINEYSEKNMSIISATFYGIIRSTMECNSCHNIKYSFQTFNLLIFQLKKIKESNRNTKVNKKYVINIYDAFDCDKEKEILDGENMIYCNNCKGLRPGIHQQIMYSLPRVLIIILNRGRNNLDFNEEFIFPKDLDLSIEGYVIKNEFNTKFYLQSVITHLGESGAGGHFIAYCRNGPNEKFLCYNDASVSEAEEKDAMGSKISENEYEKRTPYILVYHHMN